MVENCEDSLLRKMMLMKTSYEYGIYPKENLMEFWWVLE
jgi:hypothetical protein